MYVLGIETSCDETAAAVVKDGRKIISNIVSSSLRFHKKYGGVVPEIAFRKQLETITGVAQAAVEVGGIGLKDIDLISVTCKPGLLGSLLIGISFAKSMSLSLGIPLIGVNHIYSHIYANFLDSRKIKLPAVALVVSGGHTNLFYIKDFRKIEDLGQTQDDACGEAFDKVAKILGLGYPGGPLIEKMAKLGDNKKIKFHCSGTKRALDFSFSGIKTAVLYYVKNNSIVHSRRSTETTDRGPWTVDRGLLCDIAASFQEAVVDTLITKSLLACKLRKVENLILGGGVIANNRLRDKFYEATKTESLNCYFPPKDLCMDNAAMVAGLAFKLYKKGKGTSLDLNPCV